MFPLLVLSKRMHSIFVLRCFNDCWAVFFLFLAIYCFQKRMWTFGSVVYSIGLGVKMSLLLALPAVGIILLQAVGRNGAIANAFLMLTMQVSADKRQGGEVPAQAEQSLDYHRDAFSFT